MNKFKIKLHDTEFPMITDNIMRINRGIVGEDAWITILSTFDPSILRISNSQAFVYIDLTDFSLKDKDSIMDTLSKWIGECADDESVDYEGEDSLEEPDLVENSDYYEPDLVENSDYYEPEE